MAPSQTDWFRISNCYSMGVCISKETSSNSEDNLIAWAYETWNKGELFWRYSLGTFYCAILPPTDQKCSLKHYRLQWLKCPLSKKFTPLWKEGPHKALPEWGGGQSSLSRTCSAVYPMHLNLSCSTANHLHNVMHYCAFSRCRLFQAPGKGKEQYT